MWTALALEIGMWANKALNVFIVSFRNIFVRIDIAYDNFLIN